MQDRLSNYCEVISGYAFKSNDLMPEGDVPVVKIGNISNGEGIIIDNNAQYVNRTFLNLNKIYHINKGDILISLTGSHINQPNSMVGRCCRQKENSTYLLNQRAGKVLPKENINKDYLYYIFSLYSTKYAIANRAYGGANQVNVSPKDIMKIKVEINNDITIQNKIVNILAKYDNLIDNNNKRIKILEQMAENLYKEWFVRFRFPGYETTTFKSGIPSNWTIKKLKDFGRIETGKTPSTAKPENYGNAYHFVKTPDMHGNIFVIKTEEMLSEIGNNSQIKKLLPINSIMVSCIGSAGIVAINTKPAHTNQQINSIILDKPYELEWLYFTCKELKGTIQSFGANGATMTNLNKGKFEKLKVYYPTPEIISKFHQIVEPMFSELKSLLTINENLIKQRDLLLPRLMSGKLEVE